MPDGLGTQLLCEVSIELAADAPLAIGQSPWRNRRVSDIAGGRFEGPGLSGRVRASGADWSEGGRAADGGIATALDVRSLWETDDGALIYVTYQGRLVVPAAVADTFRDPARIDGMDPADYYFRICPLFETSAERYAWLNEIVAVGSGRRTRAGVVYRIFRLL
ncbi:MAG: DUF3237 domain-containing protein [Pseudomonadales bacterium]|nr:DUF3237 domain-containing protein [Pseudomonadales bacterium]